MRILVVGASGATGRLLVEQLLDGGHDVKAIVRSPGALNAIRKNAGHLSVVQASILDLGDAELALQVKGCDAVASCLGHNITWKGTFGHPRRLVTDATRRLCNGIKANKPGRPVRLVLMNTTANRNRDLHEHLSIAERCIFFLIRLLLPPHPDNENAAEFLRVQIGQHDAEIEWVVVPTR